MANKSVELTLQLKNVKSVTDLEQTIKDINSELKKVPINSQAFDEMASLSKKADTQLKEIKEDLRGFSDEKQLDSVAKIGGSLAAGFSIATVASQAFGKEAQEDIAKTIQTATQLTAVVSSIKPLIEGLTSTNRAAFSQYIEGFKQSSIYAKLFGTEAKAALTLSGIGIAILALALLVENWEAVTDAVGKFTDALGLTNVAQEKVFAAQQKNIDIAKQQLESLNHSIENQIALLTAQGEKETQIFALRRKNLQQQIEVTKSQLELDNKRLAATQEELVNAIKRNVALGQFAVLTKIFGGSIEDAAKKAGDLDKQIKTNKQTIDDLNNQLAILAANEDNYNKKVAKESADRAKQEAKQRADEEKASNDALEKFLARIRAMNEARLKAEREANDNIRQLRINALADGQQKELAQLDFDTKQREAKLIGSDQQIAEQRRLIEQDRVDKILAIQIKYSQLAQKADEDAARKKAEQAKLDKENADKQFKQEVQTIQQYAKLGLDVVSKVAQAITQTIANNINGVQAQIEIQTNAFNESTSKLQTLTAELSTTQGAAHQQVLSQIAEEQKVQSDAQSQRARLEAQKVNYQNKQNLITWETSLITAAVNTALGVTQALASSPPPFSFILAGITGALGAVELGVIAGNKPKAIPAPTFAEGGYTKGQGLRDSTGYQVAGVVHENEYVVPEHVLFSDVGSRLVNTLEAMRKGSFASGGFSSNVPVLNESKFLSLTGNDLLSAIQNSNISVSVKEINDKQTNVKVLQSRAAI
ncbi:hypothetical protein WSM22_03380 [Cytophagales bacterium WSM2-2]|nr:hypothetical protein WSM22_03380 [Cytophagales bacterium WSM2-2]